MLINSSQRMRKIIFIVLACALSIIVLSGISATALQIKSEALPTTQAEPKEIAKTSIIVERIGEFDYDEDTFNASFWITSETTSAKGNPIEGIELANSLKSSVESTGITKTGNKRIFRKRVLGTFHHPWNLNRYPFDLENLQIVLRDPKETLGNFTMVADIGDSGLRRIPKVIGEWRVRGFTFQNESRDWAEKNLLNFGAVNKEPIESDLVFTIRLANSHTKGALKLLSGGIVAAGIAAISYTLTPNIISNPNSRFGALSASLFAAVISMRSAYGYLGNPYDVTLIDKIYFLILGYIFFSFAYTSYLWRIFEDPIHTNFVQSYSYKAGAISTMTLIILIAITTINSAFFG